MLFRSDDEDRKASTAKELRRHRVENSPYYEEFSTKVDIAADPVIPYMSTDELQRSINMTRLEMLEAAKKMEFMEAARLRDELLKMEKMLAEKEAQ